MKVLVASYGASSAWSLPREQVEWLRAQAPGVELVHATSDAELEAGLQGAEVAYSWRIRGAHLARAPALRWIHSPATGVGELLSPELLASPVLLTNSRGVDARPIAEHVLALVLALSRKLPQAARRQAERAWAQEEFARAPPGLLRGKVLGLVGLGEIGREVAALAGALGLRVRAVRRRPDAPRPPQVEEVRGEDGLEWLLRGADVLVLAAPSTPRTRGLLGARALAWLPRGAVLVNVGRGDLVDEAALVAALRTGALGGAGLDVVAQEPLPPDSPLWDAPGVLLTPHTASLWPDDWPARAALFLDNLRRWQRGAPLFNLVDKAQGY